MRIIAGEYASRVLKTLKGNATRPTLDKVKEAVFSSLGGYFDGGIMLDLYAGSGAIGLEAISRGMQKAYLVDKSKEATQIIKENVISLGVQDKTKVLCMKDMQALNYFKKEGIKFNLVYLDPPYALEQNEKMISFLAKNDLLQEDAKIVVECLKEDKHTDKIDDFIIYKEAIYGITRIVYYKRGKE